jgi:GNAT superfamily N-acetyltransferase
MSICLLDGDHKMNVYLRTTRVDPIIGSAGAEPAEADLIFRPGRIEDAEQCGLICYEAFKNIADYHNFPPDFPSPAVASELMAYMLSKPAIYSVVAELDGRTVGSNFLWENEAIAGIGPITVSPEVQNDRIGRRLMEEVLERAKQQGFSGVRLVQAAYHNRSLALYTKLGFIAREPLSVMQGPPPRFELPGYEVRPATLNDVAEASRLSLAVHGHTRERELVDAIHQGTATVVIHNGRLSGYATLIGFFGHAVAESNNDLKALIGAATIFSGPGFMVPTRNSALFRWCLENGLRVVQPFTLMTMGLYNEPAGAYLPSILY